MSSHKPTRIVMKISITLVALMLVGATQASGDFVSPQGGQTANLLKRSLCNTFGGCGSKRSVTPRLAGYRMSGDEPLEDKRNEENAKLIAEILEDIVEHLQKDQNYKIGRYTMFVLRQTSDGTKFVQRVDADGAPLAISQRDPAPSNFRNEDDFLNVKALN